MLFNFIIDAAFWLLTALLSTIHAVIMPIEQVTRAMAFTIQQAQGLNAFLPVSDFLFLMAWVISFEIAVATYKGVFWLFNLLIRVLRGA